MSDNTQLSIFDILQEQQKSDFDKTAFIIDDSIKIYEESI